MPADARRRKVAPELVKELRQRFLDQLDDTTTELYHPDDIQRVKENEWFVTRYILHHRENVDKALNMLIESLQWRKEFEVNTLTRGDLPADYFNNRAVIHYNQDKNGYPLVVIRVKVHFKDEKMLRMQQQYMLYWIEKTMRRCDWGAVSILFDCTNSGVSNVDLVMTRFILNIFKKYYPWGLEYFLVCNLPWILSTVWRMIKTWIPEQYAGKVSLVDQTALREFVPEDQLPVVLGGKSLRLYEPKEGAEDVSDDEITVPEIAQC